MMFALLTLVVAAPSLEVRTATRAIDSRIHAALSELLRGDEEHARAMLEEIVAQDPEDPSASIARDLELMIERRIALTPPSERKKSTVMLAPAPEVIDTPSRVERSVGDILRAEQRTGLARAELVTGQTMHGIVLAMELCGVAECEDSRAFAAALLLGAGGGLGLSLGLSGGGVTSGQAAITNAGAEWGFWNALALNAAATDDPDEKTILGTMILGQLAGVGLSQLMYNKWRPSSGDVSLANTVGLWSGLLTTMLLVATDDVDSQTTIGAALAMSDLGLAAGIYLASRVPMSRGRALLIDLGGSVGLTVGMGLDVLAQGDDVESTDILVAGAIGAGAGLALSAYLTRNWDISESPLPHLAIAPTQGGGQLLLGGTF